ncbi:MAG: sigma-70 family RNA polymerase sigma factor [Prevotellaceae bacterium]|jgi:RNA polymerase sigma-70 factor (ECF subfamily)|nr:sigma-70 family RNA polymerase sigma factor [Prevotellaceae bacterium]
MQAASRYLEEYNMIKAICTGNTQQYITLVQRYQQTVFSMLYRITGATAQAEELTCLTFAKTYRRLRTFNFSCKFEQWIYLRALGFAIDAVKAQYAAGSPSLPDGAQPPAQKKNEQRLLLRKAVARLSKKQQTIIYLKYFEDYSYEDISEILGISGKKVKIIAYKSRKLLEIKLTQWKYFSPKIKPDAVFIRLMEEDFKEGLFEPEKTEFRQFLHTNPNNRCHFEKFKSLDKDLRNEGGRTPKIDITEKAARLCGITYFEH